MAYIQRRLVLMTLRIRHVSLQLTSVRTSCCGFSFRVFPRVFLSIASHNQFYLINFRPARLAAIIKD